MKNTISNFFEKNTIPSFGVAGNFTGHLEQAGEAVDFVNIKTKEAKAPKAVFPTYLPKKCDGITPEFLHIFPFDKSKIIFPAGEEKLQIEPECALIFNAKWNGDNLTSLTPVCFGASNDCSIRKEGAKKISQKKNWCEASKGFAEHQIELNTFTADRVINNYRIASFLVRNGTVYSYGEDSAVRDYSYVYNQLTQWLLEKFNSQVDEGPAEDIHTYLLESEKPEQIMVSIGATRYTDWGEHNFLQNGDKAVVIVYPEDKYSKEDIIKAVEKNELSDPAISALIQTVVL